MTKKDYIVIAKAVNKAYISLSYASVNMGETKRSLQTVADALAYELKLENARFDSNKFIEACGIPLY
jgi:hypothetical protein